MGVSGLSKPGPEKRVEILYGLPEYWRMSVIKKSIT